MSDKPSANPPGEVDSKPAALKAAGNTVAGVCFCSLFMFLGGAFFGWAWPAAVAVCGLAAMGAIVGYFQLKST